MRVVSDKVALRQEYDKGYIIRWLKKGDKVKAVDDKTYYHPGPRGLAFRKVSSNGDVGYVRQEAIE